MALNAEIIAAVDRLLTEKAGGDSAAAFSALRAALPGILLLRCDASDVLEDPFRSYANVDLHLVDTSDHCTVMTPDPAAATGLLLAAKAMAA